MASGRLGSAYLGPKRTTQLYSNTSGGAVSLSIMAQAKSSTANTPLSIKIDSGSTAAETETQLSTTSYNADTLKLLYNSGQTAVTGALAFSNYSSTSTTDWTIDNPSGTNVGTDRNGYTMPMCTDTTFTNWEGYSAPYFPLQADNTTKWATVSEATTAGEFTFVGDQINHNQTTKTSVSKTNSMNYYQNGVVADPYCARVPVFAYNSSNYMTTKWLDTSYGVSNNNRTSNSIMYWMSGSSNQTSNSPSQKMIHASGGMFGIWHYYSSYMFLVYYGKNQTSGSVMQAVSEDSIGSTGSSYPLYISFVQNTNGSNGYPHLVFLEYNPFTNTIFTCQNVGNSSINRVYYEWSCDKLDELLAAMPTDGQLYGQLASGKYILDDYARIVDDGLAVDRTASLPPVLRSNTAGLAAPMKRVRNKLWAAGFRDPYASTTTPYFYTTPDFLNWTEISSSDYYQEVYDADTVIASDGTATDKIVSNYTSIPDAGELEHDLSVNNYERTGLVISNGDKVYVKNNGEETGLAISAMGYEE